MKEIQTTHNVPGIVASDEYYTPLEFIEALGHFDTDPASPENPRWRTADVMYTKKDNGLILPWNGRVWLNPPYSSPLIQQFMQRLAEHGDGIALLVPKFGSRMFRDWVFPYCDDIYLLDRRIKFFDINYVQQKSPICQSVLIAYGKENYDTIIRSGMKGTMLVPQKS